MTEPQETIKNLTTMNYVLDEQLSLAKKTANAYAALYFTARLWIAEQLYRRDLNASVNPPWDQVDELSRGPWLERAANLIANLQS